MTALAETGDILGDHAAAVAIAEQFHPFTGRIAAVSRPSYRHARALRRWSAASWARHV
jgi:hypothetical protein